MALAELAAPRAPAVAAWVDAALTLNPNLKPRALAHQGAAAVMHPWGTVLHADGWALCAVQVTQQPLLLVEEVDDIIGELERRVVDSDFG